MTLLDEAAAEYRKARDDNELRLAEAARMHSGQQEEARDILAEVRETRLRIAEGLAILAAIEAGAVSEFPLHLDLPGGGS